jgi:hypothetical protein
MVTVTDTGEIPLHGRSPLVAAAGEPFPLALTSESIRISPL